MSSRLPRTPNRPDIRKGAGAPRYSGIRAYLPALGVAAAGAAAVAWSLLPSTPPMALFVAAAAAPATVLLAIHARLGARVSGGAALGGALVGPVFAIAGHAFVAAFIWAFVVGFADTGRTLLDSLRADPRITSLLSSPWVLVLLVDVVTVAPLTEEAGKALGAAIGRPGSRREAFLSGIAAGAGFAFVENVLYAVFAAVFGGPWAAILVARATGAAVHPLASGLVTLGRWDAGHGGGARELFRGYFSGVGIHALWNGSIVAVLVAETAAGAGEGGPASLAFAAALGAVLAAALWVVTRAVDEGRNAVEVVRPTDVRTLAAWIVLAASMLLPIAALTIAFPSFYGG